MRVEGYAGGKANSGAGCDGDGKNRGNLGSGGEGNVVESEGVSGGCSGGRRG